VRDLGMIDIRVASQGDYVGALVGYSVDVHVTRCYTAGAVAGRDYVGGLAGRHLGQMAHCYSKASVQGSAM